MTKADLKVFHNYVASFYMPGRNPIYPFEGLTMVDIIKATADHINDCITPFEGDSVDREAVAQILCQDYGYNYPEPPKFAYEKFLELINKEG